MSLRTRAVDFVADRDELLNVLQRNLHDVSHKPGFAGCTLIIPPGKRIAGFYATSMVRPSELRR